MRPPPLNQPANPNRVPAVSPLPAGEGWVRESRHKPPTPLVIPAISVIPALSPGRGKPGFWIPACAGMTVGAGMAAAVWACGCAEVWIPAFAGMTNRGRE